MATRSFSIGQDEEGVYLLEGELSIHDLDELRSLLDGALQDEEGISLSLAKVRFIDTAALQLLVAFKRRSGSAARLRISGVSPEIEGILSLCGLRTALL
jgi:anti-anti-sigma factor